MVGSVWEPLIAVLLLAVLVVTGAAAVAAFVAWRWVRRRVQLVRAGASAIGVSSAWDAVVTARRHRSWPPELSGVAGWTPSRARKEIRRAVGHAEAAVAAADGAGAAVADLPLLCRRLDHAAGGLDPVLAAMPSGTTVGPALAPRLVDLIRAASDLQRAAVASAGDAHAEGVRTLAEDAARELQSLDAGLAAARALTPRAG